MKNLLFLVSAMLFLTSCSKDGSAPTPPPAGDPTDITIQLINESPASRGLNGKEDGVGNENLITALEFYVFDSSGENLDPEVGEGNGYLKIGGGTSPVQLSHTIRVTSGDNKKFVVVANSDVGEPAADATYDDILAEINKYKYPSTPSTTDNPRKIRDKGFEMSGTTTANINNGTANRVYITLLRSVSKISAPTISENVPVKLSQQEQIEEIWGEGAMVSEISFNFKGFTVINGNEESTVSFVGNPSRYYKDPVGSPWSLWTETWNSNINSSFDAGGQYQNNYSGASDGGIWFLTSSDGPVYAYENKPVKVTDGYQAGSVYAYIIEGVLIPDNNPAEAATRYWRVNLTADDYYHIMRNCSYKVTINNITTPGYGTPKDAEDEEKPVPEPGDTNADFVVSIAQWDINEYGTDM